MNGRMVSRKHDERGASLMLVIAFMVLMGAISAAVISTSTSGLQQRATLDQARNRQYSADAAVETAVATARGLSGFCPSPTPAVTLNINSLNIHVDCISKPVTILGPDAIPKVQKNLSFAACIGSASCTASSTVINAQVNFQGNAPTVTTFVQAWSVNG